MKKKIIIAVSCILILSIAIIIFIIPYSSKYDRVTRDDEKTILFLISVTYPQIPEEESAVAVDNYGNIYLTNTTESTKILIESGEIFSAKIVGELSSDEVIRYYNKLRNIKRELSYDFIERFYTETEPYISYYGVRYIDGEIEYLRLGSSESVANNRTAVKIAEWMEDWEWENK